MLLAVVVFRSFYGSSEPGTTFHSRCNPVESVAPPFYFSLPSRLALPPVVPELETSQQERLTPLYHVVLLDDDEHTYDYVVEMLCKLFIMSVESAFQKAVEVDSTGRTIVITCELKQAEFGRDQIHAYGADPRMEKSKGSMRAILVPVQTRPG